MSINEFIEYLRANHVIANTKNGKLRINSMYRRSKLVSNDVLEIIGKYIAQFNSENEAWYCLKHGIAPEDRPKCPICGDVCKYGKDKYNYCCAKHSVNTLNWKTEKCSNTHKNKSKKEKEAIRQKTRNTCLKKYGDANYGLYGSDSYKTKMLEKYGDISYSNHEKAKRTCLERYGVTCNLVIGNGERIKKVWEERHDEIVTRTKTTREYRYGKHYASTLSKLSWQKRNDKSNKYEKEHNCTSVVSLKNKYGYGWKQLNIPTTTYNGQSYIDNSYLEDIKKYVYNEHRVFRSKGENEVYEYVCSLIGFENVLKNVENVLTIGGYHYELDIYVPSKKLAIEYNGVFWHSVKNKDKNCHLRKTEACEALGIHLIHIFEDEWAMKKDQIKSLLANALGNYVQKIGARLCTLKEVQVKEYQSFCNANHLQGYIPSKYKYDLYYNNELVECIGLGVSRYAKNELELYRLCTKSGIIVQGGFSKLITYASKILKRDIYSYIDRCKFTGNGYIASGWKLVGYSRPSYFYIESNSLIRHNRLKFQKSKLKNKLKIYDENLTEQQNMINNNYNCVYDCGTIKMVYKYENK